jgi:hypothetical protein
MINVLPAISNVLLADTVNVYRRREIMNGFGEGTSEEVPFRNVPSAVWPSGDNKLDRRPEAQSTDKTIELVSRFAFRAASKEQTGDRYQADLVEWRGVRFTVIKVDDYSQYGAGFTHAMATAQPVIQLGAETKGVTIEGAR